MNHSYTTQKARVSDLTSQVILLKESLQRAIDSGTGSNSCNATCTELISSLGQLVGELHSQPALPDEDKTLASRQATVALMLIGRSGWRRRQLRTDLLVAAAKCLESLKQTLIQHAIMDLDPASRTILEMMIREGTAKTLSENLNGTQMTLNQQGAKEES
tara:strand:+ start:1347 stop:1826 length:480 start_codon:yes stop_codon:yes gene_type:complete